MDEQTEDTETIVVVTEEQTLPDNLPIGIDYGGVAYGILHFSIMPMLAVCRCTWFSITNI